MKKEQMPAISEKRDHGQPSRITDWNHIKYKSFYTIIKELRGGTGTYAVVTPVNNQTEG
mgnify:CR=1 FL=1